MARVTKNVQKLAKQRYEALLASFQEVAENRNLTEEAVRELFEHAVRQTYAKTLGGDDVFVEVVLNQEALDFEARYYKVVVESDDDVEDDALQMGLEDAVLLEPSIQVGDKILISSKLLGDFNIKMSNTVSSNFRQQLIEIEKSQLLDQFKDKIGELVKGTVEKSGDRTTYINLLGMTNVLFDERGKNAIPGEVFHNGQELNFYVVSVGAGKKGANIVISRSDPNFVKKLMEREIHEIYDGTIVIHNIVREEGERVKVSVESLDPNVDPVGACIGPNANRIQKITAELGPDGRKEKIDIIPFERNTALYIMEAFRPAVPVGIKVDTETKTAIVIFTEDEKGKAFGHKGANIRLAAKLTGYHITIKEVKEAVEEGIEYSSKEHIAYEQRLLDQEKMRELIRSQIASETTTPTQRMPEDILDTLVFDEDESNENVLPGESAPVVSVEEVKEVKEEVPVTVEVASVPEEEKIIAVKTTVSLADLEKDLEKQPTATKSFRGEKGERPSYKPRFKKEDKKEEKEKPVEILPTGPKMDIYTEEELKALDAEQEVVEEFEDDIDYEDFDEYYE